MGRAILTPSTGTVSMWSAIRTANAVPKSASVDTWIKYSLDPAIRPDVTRLGCVRMICRCGSDKLIVLIQCGQVAAGYADIGGSAARRVVLLDGFDIIEAPSNLASVRCAPIHHDCARSTGPCLRARVNDAVRILQDGHDVNYFLDPNLVSVNSW